MSHRHLSRVVALLLAVAGLTLPATLAAPAHADGTVPIYGQVVDANWDGLDGVTVTALDPSTLKPVGSAAVSGEPPAGADPDPINDSGEFTLSVPQGSYEIEYSKPGYASTYYSNSDQPSIVTVDGAGNLTISDESDDDLFTPGALDPVILVGTTNYALTGSVNVSGGSAQGITVSAYLDGDDDPEDVVATATVASDGSYSLSLPTGTYDLSYIDPAHKLAPVWYGGATDAPGTVVTVHTAPVALSAVSMKAPTATSFPIRGTVTDLNGDPLGHVTVTATPAGGGAAMSGTSGADGTYSVTVPVGSYTVSFSATGFATTPYTVDDSTTAATVQMNTDGTLAVYGDDLVANRLDDTALPGTAQYDVTGIVTDAGGAALSGITVTAYDSGDDTVSDAVATTNSSGGYDLKLPIGTYDIEATSPSAAYVATWLGTASTHSAVEVSQSGKVSVDDGATVASLPTIKMSAVPACAAYDLAGVVDDANGDPLNGITVQATAVSATTPDGCSPATTLSTTTAADTATGDAFLGGAGVYRLHLQPGTYTLTYSAPSYTTTAYTIDGSASPAQIVVGKDGTIRVLGETLSGNTLDSVAIASTTTYALTGVADGPGGSPAAGVSVKVFDDGDTSSPVTTATTGASGSYSLSLPTGTYDIEFLGSAYLPKWYGGDGTGPVPVKVSSAGAVTVGGTPISGHALATVTLATPPSNATFPVAGEVDFNDDPVDGITVTVTPTGSTAGSALTTTTGPDTLTGAGGLGGHGIYRFSLAPGTYQLTYSGSGYDTASYPTTDGGTATVTVATNGQLSSSDPIDDLSAGYLDPVDLASSVTTKFPVSGTATDSTGTPLSGITVEAFEDGDTTGPVATTTTGADGSFALAATPGVYNLRLTDNRTGNPTTTYKQTWYGGATPHQVKIGTSGTVTIDETPLGTTSIGAVSMPTASTTSPEPLVGEVDFNDDPVDNIQVTATPVAGSTGATATVTTGPDTVDSDSDDYQGPAGIYRLSLLPGTYTLAYSATGYQTAYYNVYGAVTSAASASTITIKATGQVLINAAENTNTPEDLLDPVELASTVTATTAVTGVVTNAGGTPLSGVTVTAYAEGDPATKLAGPVTTASDGTYSLPLSPGTYNLYFTSTDYSPGWYAVDSNGTNPHATPKNSDASVVKVFNGGAVKVDDTTLPGTSVGSVALAAASNSGDITGQVVDSNGDPLAGVTVHAYASTDTTASSPVASSVTGAAGRYDLTVAAGLYYVSFSAPTSAYQPVTSFYNADDDPLVASPTKADSDGDKASTVTVAANGTVTVASADPQSQPAENDGDLDAWTMIGTATQPLTGTVTDADGKPLSGVTVAVYDDGDDTTVVTKVTTDSTGAYSFALPVGSYDLSFTAAGYDAAWYGGMDESDAPAAVKIATGGSVSVSGGSVGDRSVAVAGGHLDTVALPAASADQTYPLRGWVDVFDLDGSLLDDGLDDVTVTATPTASTCSSTQPVTTTTVNDPDQGQGYYTLQLPACTYTLTFEAAGYPTNTFMPGASFFDDGGLLTDPKGDPGADQPRAADVITVASTGVTTTDTVDDLAGPNMLNPWVMLKAGPKQVKAPAITGTAAPGQTLHASLGTWAPALTKAQTNDDVTIMWFVGGKIDQAGAYSSSIKVPANAVGKPIWFTMSYDPSSDTGQMPIFVKSSTVKAALAKATVTVAKPKRPTTARTTLAVKVAVKGVAKPTGTVTVLDGKKKVGKPVKLGAATKGKLTIKLTKLKKGKHTLTVVFAGSGAAGTSKPVKITVK